MIGCDIKLHRRTKEPLQQRVVQVLGDTCSLCKPFFEAHIQLSRKAAQPQAVKDQHGQPGSSKAGEAKQPCLPEDRLDIEFKNRLRSVPEALAVACYHSEPVCAWTEVRVDGLASRDNCTPILIKPIQSVPEPDSFGNRETQTGVAERDPLATARNMQGASHFNRTAICCDAFDVDDCSN